MSEILIGSDAVFDDLRFIPWFKGEDLMVPVPTHTVPAEANKFIQFTHCVSGDGVNVAVSNLNLSAYIRHLCRTAAKEAAEINDRP